MKSKTQTKVVENVNGSILSKEFLSDYLINSIVPTLEKTKGFLAKLFIETRDNKIVIILIAGNLEPYNVVKKILKTKKFKKNDVKGLVFFSDAWYSPRPKGENDPDFVMPSKDPNRKSCVLIFGMNDKTEYIAADVPYDIDDNGKFYFDIKSKLFKISKSEDKQIQSRFLDLFYHFFMKQN